MSNKINPFNPGAGKDPPHMAGRDEELDTFSSMLWGLKEGKTDNAIIYGPRGVGKTVLLHRMIQMCLENDLLPIVRFQYSPEYSKPEKFLKILQYDVDKITETFSKIAKTKKKIQTFADYIKPENFQVLGVVSYKPSYKVNTEAPMVDQITEYLQQKWKSIEKNGYKGVVVLLDEFHTVVNKEQNEWHTLTDFIGAINEIQSRCYMKSYL